MDTPFDFLSLVNCPDRRRLLDAVAGRFADGRGFALATLNLDHIVKLRRDPAFRAAYEAQDLVVADGNPVVWLRDLSRRPVELVPGSELVMPLAALAAEMSMPVAFLGSTEPTLDAAADRMIAACPGLRVVAKLAPPQGFDPDSAEADWLLDALADSGARLCFLALGAPKQEILSVRGKARVPDCGFASIGAGLDFIAGTQKRAPALVQRFAMEWFWRMASNPRRLGRRYWDCARVLAAMTGPALKARARARHG